MNCSEHILKILAVAILVLSASVSRALGATYYIAASGGSDTNTGSSPSQSWATFNYAWSRLKPGDTLILQDGVYYQSLKPTISGTQAAPITIRSQNDGGAVIDGQNQRVPCSISGSSGTPLTDIIVEGIKCQNSNGDVFGMVWSNRITIRRVSAYNSAAGNYVVFSLWHASDSLLEDVAASGSGRVMYNVLDSARITIRRCWGLWGSLLDHGTGPKMIIQIYGSDDSLIENCVGAKKQTVNASVEGMGVWVHYYNKSGDRNRFYGNVVYDLPSWAYSVSSAQHRVDGSRFINNVSINVPYGFFQRADADLVVDKLTIIGTTKQTFSVQADSDYPGYPKDSDFEINGTVRNSIFLSGGTGFYVSSSIYPINSFTHAFNNLYDITTPYAGETTKGTGEINLSPGFNVSKYGKGAYLMTPGVLEKSGESASMGADIRYRYQDGVLTTIPLWPWPMEDRILKETGISVTWESQGGLWKTLDGVYTTGPDTSPPQTPTGLQAN